MPDRTSSPDRTVGRRNAATILLLLCGAQFMVILDTTIVNVALPDIRTGLGFGSDAELQYVISLYALTFGGTLILAGRLADLFGRRRLFAGGLLLFSLASLACGLAPGSGALLAARAVQGLGGAVVSAAALSLLGTEFAAGAARSRALAVWGATGGAAGAAGLLVGGALSATLGWAWIFLINVPIGLLAALATPRVLRGKRPNADRPRLDLLGAVLVTGGLGLFVWTASQIETWGLQVWTVTLGVASLACLLLFLLRQRHAANALLPLRLFAVRGLGSANVVMLGLNAIIASQLFFTTLYVQDVLGYSALTTGLAFLPNSLLVIVGSTVASRLVPRIGLPGVLAIGLLVVALSALLLSPVPVDGYYWSDVFPGFSLAGLGLGITFVGATVGATTGVPDADQGIASGVVNSAQQVGFALGIAVIVSAAMGVADTAGVADAARLAGYQAGYLLDAGVGFLLAVGVLFGGLHRRGTQAPVVGDATQVATSRRNP